MHLATRIDLWGLWPGAKPDRGWQDWTDVQEEEEEEKNASKWQCKWDEAGSGASSSSNPARRGRSPSQPARGKVPWSHRYLTRGFHSQQRREERLRLEKEGKPVPPHLLPHQIQMCKSLKRQMWELQQQQRNNAQEPEEAKPAEAAKEGDVPMEPAPPPDIPMPGRGRSASVNRGKMGPRSLTPAMGRGTPAQPGVQGSFLKAEVQQEEEECEEEEEEQDDEMAKPVEAEGQKKQTNARKEKSLQRLRLKSKKNLRTTRKILMVVMVVALHHLQKSHHCPHLHLSQIFLPPKGL